MPLTAYRGTKHTPGASSNSTQSVPGTKYTPTQAAMADALPDSVGVNIHSNYGGVWNDYTAMTSALTSMGIRHVRERLANLQSQRDAWAALNAAGIDIDCIVCHVNDSAATRDNLLSLLNGFTVRPAWCEGVNEPNLQGNATTWPADAKVHQLAIFNATQAGSAYSNLIGKPVLAPALGKKSGYTTLGDINDRVNYGNVHGYPGGDVPDPVMDTVLTGNLSNTTGKPVILSETGFQNWMTWPDGGTDGNWATPYDTSAYYATRAVMEAWLKGIARTYLYEAVDDGGAATNKERHFGLCFGDAAYVGANESLAWLSTVNYGAGAVTSKLGAYYRALAANTNSSPPSSSWATFATPSAWSLKVAGQALGNLNALLADPGVAFTPGLLDFDVPGEPSTMQDVLFQKRDGSFWLVVWRRMSAYARLAGGGSYTNVPAVSQILNFGASRTVSVYRPHLSTNVQSTFTGTTGTISVGPEVVVCKIV